MKWGYLLAPSAVVLTYSVFRNVAYLAVASGIALAIIVKSFGRALLDAQNKEDRKVTARLERS